MKAPQLVLILTLLSTNLFSQDVNYYFEQFSHTYSNLNNPISLNNGEIWDDFGFSIPMEFDFLLFGESMDSIVSESSSSTTLVNTEMNSAILISPSDLSDRAYNTDGDSSLSPISYQVDGQIGSQILKIEWKNAGFYEDEEGVYYTNLQVWFYESSHMIEIHRGASYIEESFYLWEEDLCALLEMDLVTQTATGYVVEEVDGEYQFGFQYVDDFYDPNTFTQIPEDGTVFRFYPEYAIGIVEKETVGINLFPNPTSDYITLQNKQNTKLNYKILSVDGRVVLKGSSSAQNLKIDLRTFKSGMYIVRGSKEGIYFTKSFIIN